MPPPWQIFITGGGRRSGHERFVFVSQIVRHGNT